MVTSSSSALSAAAEPQGHPPPPPPPRSDSHKTALEWKEEGNRRYGEKGFSAAAECYSQALALDPAGPTTAYLYLSNRASCFLQLEKWAEAAADARRSLALAPAEVPFPKGHYRLAKACLEMGKYGAANEVSSRCMFSCRLGHKLTPFNPPLLSLRPGNH